MNRWSKPDTPFGIFCFDIAVPVTYNLGRIFNPKAFSSNGKEKSK
jgi:hypothetical protein